MTIKLMDMDRFTKSYKEVTSSEVYISKGPQGGTFHPNGLFSEEIFGNIETRDRKTKFGFITLNTKVIHPSLISILKRIERKLLNAINRDKKYKIDIEGYLVEDEHGDIFGMSAVVENINKIKFRGGTESRENLVSMLDHYKKSNQLLCDIFPVIPPAYRDIIPGDDSGENIDPLNDYYKVILRLSTQLRASQQGLVFDILSANMQHAINELYLFVSKKISKKEGLIRHDILGKRVDFSARAVIAGGGTELEKDEIGVPLRVLVKLFEPFILFELLNSGNIPKEELAAHLLDYNQMELSVNTLRSLLEGISRADEITPGLQELIELGVNRAIADKIVIAKRDPALHTESALAFRPKLVKGNTIRLNTLYCGAFGADFDGDQMALYTPLTKESIEEAKERMVTIESKDGMNKIAIDFSKDIVAGVYCLTSNPSKKITSFKSVKFEQDILEMEPFTGVVYKGIKTTAGRVIFNNILPDNFPFINEPVNKKILDKKILDLLYKKYSNDVFGTVGNNIQNLGFKWYTLFAPTFSINDLEIPQSIYKLKEKLNGATTEEAQKILDKMESMLVDYLNSSGSSLGVLNSAGATKGMGQIRQILVAKGLIADIEGNVMAPISNSYADGTTAKEFFDMSPGNRKGIVDRVINTADTGYLSRQLVYALQSVELQTKKNDCGTKRFLEITATPDISKRLIGRKILTQKGTLRYFNPETDTGKLVKLRSPMYCQSTKLCLTCYGDLALRNKSLYVGITAATILGERGTQMIMKSFHTGGAVGADTIDIISQITKVLPTDIASGFENIFKQVDNSIVSKMDGDIIINTNDYTDVKNDVIIQKDKINLLYGFFTINIDGKEYDITLDYECEIDISHGYEQNNNMIYIPFKAGNKFIVCKPTSDDMAKQSKLIQAILSGRKTWKNEVHYFQKIYDQFQNLTDCDLVHFEVLCSNLLRDLSNPRVAARLNPKKYQPMVGNIKNIPSLESWLSSLAFENFNKSIETALVYPRNKEESVLEKMVTGNL